MPSGVYTHYMQRIDRPGFPEIDIEEVFKGVLYSKAEGTNTIGKPKNVYTESYAEAKFVRYWLPEHDEDYCQEATTVNMTFLIVGSPEERESLYDAFTNYVRIGVHTYRDTARMRPFTFIVVDEIKVSDEKWHGTTPYIEVEIPMLNVQGYTTFEDMREKLLATENDILVKTEDDTFYIDMNGISW